jgi:predicted component of type VI protein secretion system
MLQVTLKVVGGKQDGKTLPLTSRKFLVGREQDCQLRPNSDLVSRHHCVFTNDGFSIRLRDLGSTNGTFVNDERLFGEVGLKSGDRVRVGKLEFEVVVVETADVRQPEPVTTGGGLPDAPDSGASSPSEKAPEPPASDTNLETQTAELSGSDTSYELPVQPPSGDTAVTGWPAPPPGQPPGYPQQAPGYPPPGAWPQQPYGGYPYPPPYPYPPQYPYAPPYPPGPQPPQGYPQPEQGAPDSEGVGDQPQFRLPPPEATGAQEAESAPSEGAAPKPGDESANPSNLAADIIRQYRHRR